MYTYQEHKHRDMYPVFHTVTCILTCTVHVLTNRVLHELMTHVTWHTQSKQHMAYQGVIEQKHDL